MRRFIGLVLAISLCIEPALAGGPAPRSTVRQSSEISSVFGASAIPPVTLFFKHLSLVPVKIGFIVRLQAVFFFGLLWLATGLPLNGQGKSKTPPKPKDLMSAVDTLKMDSKNFHSSLHNVAIPLENVLLTQGWPLEDQPKVAERIATSLVISGLNDPKLDNQKAIWLAATHETLQILLKQEELLSSALKDADKAAAATHASRDYKSQVAQADKAAADTFETERNGLSEWRLVPGEPLREIWRSDYILVLAAYEEGGRATLVIYGPRGEKKVSRTGQAPIQSNLIRTQWVYDLAAMKRQSVQEDSRPIEVYSSEADFDKSLENFDIAAEVAKHYGGIQPAGAIHHIPPPSAAPSDVVPPESLLDAAKAMSSAVKDLLPLGMAGGAGSILPKTIVDQIEDTSQKQAGFLVAHYFSGDTVRFLEKTHLALAPSKRQELGKQYQARVTRGLKEKETLFSMAFDVVSAAIIGQSEKTPLPDKKAVTSPVPVADPALPATLKTLETKSKTITSWIQKHNKATKLDPPSKDAEDAAVELQKALNTLPSQSSPQAETSRQNVETVLHQLADAHRVLAEQEKVDAAEKSLQAIKNPASPSTQPNPLLSFDSSMNAATRQRVYRIILAQAATQNPTVLASLAPDYVALKVFEKENKDVTVPTTGDFLPARKALVERSAGVIKEMNTLLLSDVKPGVPTRITDIDQKGNEEVVDILARPEGGKYLVLISAVSETGSNSKGELLVYYRYYGFGLLNEQLRQYRFESTDTDKKPATANPNETSTDALARYSFMHAGLIQTTPFPKDKDMELVPLPASSSPKSSIEGKPASQALHRAA